MVGMFRVEFLNEFSRILGLRRRHPEVMFGSIAFPLDEVLDASSSLPGCYDFFNLVFFLVAFDYYRWGRWWFLLVCRRWGDIWGEE